MRLHTFTFLLTFWASCSHALYESDAGVVDWHKRLVGVPYTDTVHTSPTFHRLSELRNTKSLVITATKSNALAALDAVDGSVAWRYVFEPQDKILTFSKSRSVVASLSGAGGATLRSFDALEGVLLLEKRLHEPETGLLIQPSNLGTFITFGNSTRDIYTLTNGRTVSYVTADASYGNGGDVVWSWLAEEQAAQILYSTIHLTADTLYVVGLSSSFASYTLRVTALSPVTGEVLASSSVPSSISNGLDDFLVLSDAVVWLENSEIKTFSLSPSLKGKPAALKASSYGKLLDIGLGSHGMFIAIKPDGSGQLFTLENGNVVPTKEFKASAKSESFYASGFDKEGRPYISSTYWSPTLKAAAVEIFAPHLAQGKGHVIGYTFPFDNKDHGMISHVAMEAANPSSTLVLGRLFVTTSTGAVQAWQQGAHIWTREEGLAEVNAAEFVELPELVSVLSGDLGRSEEGFVGRLVRQIKDAKDLPDYIARFAKRFATGSYESATSSAVVSPPSGPRLSIPFRDAFGFRQILVVTTTYGKAYGIDTSNGEVLWSRVLGSGSKSRERGAKTIPIEDKMFIIKTVSDVDDGADSLDAGAGPEVILLAKSVSEESTSEDILLFHLNALTGQDAVKSSTSSGSIITSKSLLDAYLLQRDEKKVVVLLDSELQVHMYPDDSVSRGILSTATANTSLSVPLRINRSNGQRKLVGHQIARKSNAEYSAYPTWTLSLPEGQDVQSVITPIQDPIASIGKVLGNRTTLYKYLNPHTTLVLTAPHSSSAALSLSSHAKLDAHCGLFLIDSVKGTVLYQTVLPTERRSGTCNVKATFTENWLVYHYYDDEYEGPGQSKGYKMVTVELYEGKFVDDKTRSSELTSYSDKMTDITAYEQSFIYPHAISAITLTSTKFGITSKDVIVANVNGKIQSFSRRSLNPRRPVGRKPTSQEQEEFLIQYEPLLPDDPRKVLPHNYDVPHIRSIITSPALLESTSLVFAYGLDLFLTRVAPSNTFDVLSESFNKVQLVLTVMALAAAIFVTRPMVKRKKLRERWY